MNVIEQAQLGYAPTQFAIRTTRSVEAQLITQITSRLQKLRNASRQDFPKLMAALHDNRRMWNTMAIDVADKGNALPKELRAQIFYLAEFTDQHTQQILRKKADIAALIDINMAVLRGLNGQERA
ncbi:flagellar biosynthesis regulator FlaF [Yoonia sp. R78084]|uniref:flagellar biosynthesis regulator FlaF n=1 Tax=Yoonia sp. R78084 TaxID=3093869 RepID=UPI0037DCD401